MADLELGEGKGEYSRNSVYTLFHENVSTFFSNIIGLP